ncbi:MAG: murein biosynthesis integral membrane protein MurJ [Proteobacteria bacterium]|nr:murein biosynthesis integral membrane protein MurJ [Pseudomonadota bacterium]
MKENRRVVKAAGIVGLYTLLSRILGFARDMVIAFFFGSGMITDAFIAAFRLPNLMRRLFAEGSLVLSFVPVFTDYLETKSREDAFQLAGSALKVLTLILVVVTVLGVIFSPLILSLLAPGFDQNPDKMALAVSLTRIVFPYVFFVCLVALCMGILNSLGHFSAPALAPVLLNVAMITGLLGGVYFSSDNVFRIKSLAWGVIAGGAIQLGFQVPFLVRQGFRFWKKTPLFHPGLNRIGRMMLPSVLGAGVYQVNIVAGTILASLLVEGSMTWLYYADRVFQFPLGIFAISMGTAVLPSLSRQAASGDIKGLKHTFSQGLCFVFFITLPASVGLIVLSEPIVAVLFKRGEFGSHDLVMTSRALIFYTLGLCSVSAVRVTAPVFYARQDARTPVVIAVISILINILLSMLLMGPMQHAGLAFATSLASTINLALLLWAIRKQLGRLGGRVILLSVFRSLLCALAMGAVVHGLAIYLIPAYNVPVFQMIATMVLCIGTGILVYAVLAFLTRSPELHSVMTMLKKR